jgi:hypothetical protein
VSVPCELRVMSEMVKNISPRLSFPMRECRGVRYAVALQSQATMIRGEERLFSEGQWGAYVSYPLAWAIADERVLKLRPGKSSYPSGSVGTIGRSRCFRAFQFSRRETITRAVRKEIFSLSGAPPPWSSKQK